VAGDVALVLVIAADLSIESLVGELISFAGHRPILDVTAGAAGESVRRSRPDVVFIDTSLQPDVVDACVSAAQETLSPAVLISSTASASELADEAKSAHCAHFVLPALPGDLARVVADVRRDATTKAHHRVTESQRNAEWFREIR
jgi:DNA-binding NtrC family response regulator